MNNKFRVWVNSGDGEGYMIYLKPTIGEYDFENGYVLSFVEDGYEGFSAHENYDKPQELLKKKLKFMEFSYRKDSRGVEIYEGDYVARTIGNRLKEITTVKRRDSGEWYPFDYSGGGEFNPESCTVLGNMFENPDITPSY